LIKTKPQVTEQSGHQRINKKNYTAK